MPFDDDLPAQFQQVLDTTGNDRDAAWEFVYERIMYLYDALYPIMLDSTLYMPASRDLSNGKRTVLKMYRDLVLANG